MVHSKYSHHHPRPWYFGANNTERETRTLFTILTFNEVSQPFSTKKVKSAAKQSKKRVINLKVNDKDYFIKTKCVN